MSNYKLRTYELIFQYTEFKNGFEKIIKVEDLLLTNYPHENLGKLFLIKLRKKYPNATILSLTLILTKKTV